MFESFLITAVMASMPILFGCLGTMKSEKAGMLNLGTEGIMLFGGFIGYLIALKIESVFLSILIGMIAGGLFNLIYAFLTVTLKTNQTVTGLTLAILGGGLADTLGKKYVGVSLSLAIKEKFGKIGIYILKDIPYIGNILFNQNVFVYIAYILIIVLTIYYKKTSKGLNLQAVGDNPRAAESVSINVNLYKYVHLFLAGAIISLGGMALTLGELSMWQEGVTMGRGWIAIALVIFSGWIPYRALIGAFIFGSLSVLRFYFPIPVSAYFIDMIPYLITIIVLVIMSAKKNSNIKPPLSLGVSYFREER